MSHLGVYVDQDDELYNPNVEELYRCFSDYFDDPIMTKLKDVNGCSMYIVRIYALLGIEYRYVIVFITANDKSIGHQERLSKLKWLSLQTRTMTENYEVKFHSYTQKRTTLLEKKISLVKSDEKTYEYNVQDLPLKLILLSTGKSKGAEYNSAGTIISALETYNTVLVLK